MSARRIRVLIAIVVVLGGLGGVLLYATGRGALLGTLVAVIACVGLVLVIVTGVAQGDWRFLEWFNPLECCSAFCVFGVTSVVMIGGFLLWHSLLVTALAGGSIIVMMLIVLSIFTATYKADRE